MRWLQLDAESVIRRSTVVGQQAVPPTLLRSMLHGIAGFTLVSMAGFAPWAVTGKWLVRHAGEIGMYAACAIVFIALSGPFLHGLIAGPGSLLRFYALFGIAFLANAIAWTVCWILIRGHAGSLAGLFAGNLLMGLAFCWTFGTFRRTPAVVAVLFAANALGYFVGGLVEGQLVRLESLALPGLVLDRRQVVVTAMLSWGLCYGIGLGAGLGAAFFLCQQPLRDLLKAKSERKVLQ